MGNEGKQKKIELDEECIGRKYTPKDTFVMEATTKAMGDDGCVFKGFFTEFNKHSYEDRREVGLFAL